MKLKIYHYNISNILLVLDLLSLREYQLGGQYCGIVDKATTFDTGITYWCQFMSLLPHF